jgi:2-haloacid dehalogenase
MDGRALAHDYATIVVPVLLRAWPNRENADLKRLDGIKACVFDAYGTLFDFASAAARCQDVPDQKLSALTTLWREKQLQYTWLRSLQESFVDFWRVTEDALEFTLDSLGIASPELQRNLMELYLTPAPFPEVPSVLAQLRQAGFKTAILSNGSVTMLDSAVRAAGLSEQFDAILSVDAVKVFKPHPRVYAYGLEKLGLRADEVSFQSSNAWDAYGASNFGLRVVWCNRYNHRAERLPGAPDFEIRSLSELPELLTPPASARRAPAQQESASE